MLPLANAIAVKRRRVQGKCPPPEWYAALQAERFSEADLAMLRQDARRFHVHYTHVRTHDANHRQPDQMTRKQLWDHLVKVYREAYPCADSPTGSILQFGVVAKERHKDAASEQDRSEHNHVATFSNQAHYWRRVRKVSADKYGVLLNAVAHDGYCTMYRYLRAPTSKKPLSELDISPWYSPGHPQGDALKQLLDAGEETRRARAARSPRVQTSTAEEAKLRSKFGFAFNWVVDNDLRGREGAIQLQEAAVLELKKGNSQLIDFVKCHRHDLEDQLAFMWDLVQAPSRLMRLRTSREDILLEAAKIPPDASKADDACANKTSRCELLYEAILTHHGVNSVEFRHMLFQTLTAGRSKGNALMIVGGKDTGKTTITQPAAHVFKSMPTPQSDSFCPLQNIRGYELFLWQDLRYSPGHPDKDQQGLRVDEGTWNRWLEGLPTLIGVPKTDGGRADFVYDEDAAFLFTGPFQFVAYRDRRPDIRETEQLSTRIRYVHFANESPPPRTCGTLSPCGLCWARWTLRGEVAYQARSSGSLDATSRRILETLWPNWNPLLRTESEFLASAAEQTTSARALATGGPSTPVANPSDAAWERMVSLMEWRSRGLLTDAEFHNAKRMLGL